MTTQPPAEGTITRILAAARSGAAGAQNDLFERTLSECRAIARAHLEHFHLRGRKGETSLVNDAVVRLAQREKLNAESRRQFFFVMRRAMHDVLVEQFEAAAAKKRGGGWRRVEFDDAPQAGATVDVDPAELRAAVDDLEGVDENAARALMLIEVYGSTIREAADVLDRTFSQTRDDYDYARAWLKRRLRRGSRG